jgi:hypothetical protein
MLTLRNPHFLTGAKPRIFFLYFLPDGKSETCPRFRDYSASDSAYLETVRLLIADPPCEPTANQKFSRKEILKWRKGSRQGNFR